MDKYIQFDIDCKKIVALVVESGKKIYNLPTFSTSVDGKQSFRISLIISMTKATFCVIPAQAIPVDFTAGIRAGMAWICPLRLV
jgi:hypothetical protein